MNRSIVRSFPLVLVLLTLAWLAPNPAAAGRDEVAKVDEATSVLSEIMAIPEKAIPPELLRNAHGVAVIPGLIKAGFVVGGRYGTGIVVTRKKGGWSNPSFISLTGGSVGWQIGAQATDVILVFKTERGIENIKRGKFTLGADISVAAGPVGRHAEAGTDVQLKAEIYSYSRSRGLFAGLAIEGAALQIDDNANADFYGKSVTPDQVFTGRGVKTPGPASKFIRTLSRYTTGKVR